jgi:hypothetical protein
MDWNGLNAESIIRPGQRLLLRVTPPTSTTPTPVEPTVNEAMDALTPTPTHTRTQTSPRTSPTLETIQKKQSDFSKVGIPIGITIIILAVLILSWAYRIRVDRKTP